MKSVPAAKYRKKYVFFEKLKFLEAVTLIKPTKDSLLESDDEQSRDEGGRAQGTCAAE